MSETWLPIAGHDGYSGYPRSLLDKADKYSWYISPYWWLWLNNIIEPYIRFGMTNREAVLDFRAWVKEFRERLVDRFLDEVSLVIGTSYYDR